VLFYKPMIEWMLKQDKSMKKWINTIA
jgi:hypothetical protein